MNAEWNFFGPGAVYRIPYAGKDNPVTLGNVHFQKPFVGQDRLTMLPGGVVGFQPGFFSDTSKRTDVSIDPASLGTSGIGAVFERTPTKLVFGIVAPDISGINFGKEIITPPTTMPIYAKGTRHNILSCVPK